MMKQKKQVGAEILETSYADKLAEFKSDIDQEGAYVPTYIAGIEIPDSAEKEKIISAVSEEQILHTKLCQKLNDQGLERSAIVPTEMFEHIKKEKGFYTFRTIDRQSRVKADVKNYYEKANSESIFLMIGVMSIFTALVTGLILAVSDVDISTREFWMITLGTLLLGGIIRGLASFMISYIVTFGNEKASNVVFSILLFEVVLFEYLQKKYVQKNGKKVLWPNLTDVDIQDQKIENDDEANTILANTSVKLRLHPAPKRVKDRLAQWEKAGYKPYLVTDAAAFEVVFDGKLKDTIRRLKALRDPMPCVDIDGFTVIIDQYGPFMSEVEVVKHISKHFGLLKKKLNISEN